MKNITWVVLIVAVVAAIAVESRFAIIIDSPIVARMDRLTGETWIVNSGTWRKVAESDRAPCLPCPVARSTPAKQGESSEPVK